MFEDILGESHSLKDKTEYVEHVALPLIETGLVGRDELSNQMIIALFEKSIIGNDTVKVRGVLSACLPTIDGNLSLLYDLSQKTVMRYKEGLKQLRLKSEEEIFSVAKESINLRVILMHLVQQYERRTNPVIDAIKALQEELDKSLDEYGLGKSKRLFEY